MGEGSFSGRVAVITGGTGPLGSAVAESFAQAGAEAIAVGSRDADLTDAADARRLAADVRERHGRCDALVCCAGGGFASGVHVHDDGAPELWQRQLALNTTTAFNACHAFLPMMLERAEGAIVLVGSRAALQPFPGAVPYAVSKAATIALAQALHAEVRMKGLTVNAIVPSTIDTPQNRAASPDADTSNWVPPARIAALVLALCGEAGRATGGLIPVYGRA